MLLPTISLINTIWNLGKFYECFTTHICEEFCPKIVKEIFKIVKEDFAKSKLTLVKDVEDIRMVNPAIACYGEVTKFSEYTVNNLMRRTMKETEIHEMVDNWWMELCEFVTHVHSAL